MIPDETVRRGIDADGIPIKISSWHSYTFTSASASSRSMTIQENSRSVKAIFAVQKRSEGKITADNGATFFDTSATGGSLSNYQFRIGGTYMPAAPVECSTSNGSGISNGGAEAYIELQKAVNILGDYRLSTGCNVTRWAIQNSGSDLQEFDYMQTLVSYGPNGVPVIADSNTQSQFSGSMGSQCFAMAVSLSTNNGLQISGLNAAEQSGITLIANWSKPQVMCTENVPSNIEIYVYYDAMFLLKANNAALMIQ